MVKQRQSSKTSSTSKAFSEFYEVIGNVCYSGSVVKAVDVVCSSKDGDYFAGTFSREPADLAKWSVLPHVALANLMTYDAEGVVNLRAITINSKSGDPRPTVLPRLDLQAGKRFLMKYGVLYHRHVVYVRPLSQRFLEEEDVAFALPEQVTDIPIKPDDHVIFREKIGDFTVAQNLLRAAWAGDSAVVDIFLRGELDDGFELTAFGVNPNYPKGVYSAALLETQHLWAFICFLFLLDRERDRTGVCANPDCLAPYYLKKKRIQKICEAGPCTSWAQRQYANRWWAKEGQKRRKAKQLAEDTKRTRRSK
jgi:hypothetical protein